jgi:CcmD family protein
MKRNIFLILFQTNIMFAQGEHSADFMRSIGKIYVVVGVIVATFLGIVAYLIYLDRKLTNIENQISSNK